MEFVRGKHPAHSFPLFRPIFYPVMNCQWQGLNTTVSSVVDRLWCLIAQSTLLGDRYTGKETNFQNYRSFAIIVHTNIWNSRKGDIDAVLNFPHLWMTQTRLQWSTYRKWHPGYQMLTRTVTSRDRERSRSRRRYSWMQVSRKPLEIEARFQWATNKKWPMANRMITWPMTSRDLMWPYKITVKIVTPICLGPISRK